MKKLFTILLLLNTLLIKAQCTYNNPTTLPGVINSGEVLCISTDKSYSTSIRVLNGGIIRIYNNSTLTISGSITVDPGGYIDFEDCNSKLHASGSYYGVYNTCELRLYCDCSIATNPLIFTGWSKVFDDWCCLPPLPVELLYFKYTLNNNYITFNWSTATEINNDYFEILISDNTQDWYPITPHILSKNSNSITQLNYSYSIENINYKYAKLRQTDLNGTFSDSRIITINNTLNKNNLITTEINNTNNTILINNNYLDNIIVNFYDINGRLINYTYINKGINSINVKEITNNYKGMIIINIGTISEKMFLQ